MYLIGPFCFGLFVFHSSPGAGFVSEKIVLGIRSRTVRPWDPGFCLKPSISVYGPGPVGIGVLFFVWDEFLLVRLQKPVFFIAYYHYYYYYYYYYYQ